MRLRKKLTDKEQTIIQDVFDHFDEIGEWPDSLNLNVKLRSLGDLWENTEKLGFDYITAEQHGDSPKTTITVLGLSCCEGSTPILSLFLEALKFCCKKYVNNTQDPKVTGIELMTQLKIEHDPLTRLVLLLKAEHRFISGHNNSVDSYNFEMTLSKNILKYEDIDTIDKYIEKAYPWAFIDNSINEDNLGIINNRYSIWTNGIPSSFPGYDFSISPLDLLQSLHPDIYNNCHKLFLELHYSEAVEKAFKVVKNRLRDLSGHEKASDAFGKGKLHIVGASETHVDHDFNEAVKFLLMSIDFFRNEAFHSLDSRINEPDRAYEYLVLCSLAMNLLDNAHALADE